MALGIYTMQFVHAIVLNVLLMHAYTLDASANALFISIFWPFQHWNEMREKDSDV